MSTRPWLVYAQFGLVWALCLSAIAFGISYLLEQLSEDVHDIEAQLRIPEEISLRSDFPLVHPGIAPARRLRDAFQVVSAPRWQVARAAEHHVRWAAGAESCE